MTKVYIVVLYLCTIILLNSALHVNDLSTIASLPPIGWPWGSNYSSACQWLDCDVDGHIINFTVHGLTTNSPMGSLTGLSKLLNVDISRNNFTGSLSSLPQGLASLNFSYNLFSNYNFYVQALKVDGSHNQLNGSIITLPMGIKYIDLSYNKLTLTFPSVYILSNLTYIDLSYNEGIKIVLTNASIGIGILVYNIQGTNASGCLASIYIPYCNIRDTNANCGCNPINCCDICGNGIIEGHEECDTVSVGCLNCSIQPLWNCSENVCVNLLYGIPTGGNLSTELNVTIGNSFVLPNNSTLSVGDLVINGTVVIQGELTTNTLRIVSSQLTFSGMTYANTCTIYNSSIIIDKIGTAGERITVIDSSNCQELFDMVYWGNGCPYQETAEGSLVVIFSYCNSESLLQSHTFWIGSSVIIVVIVVAILLLAITPIRKRLFPYRRSDGS